MATGLFTGGKTKTWQILSIRIPPEDHQALVRKHPNPQERATVVRALIQMHIKGKLPPLEHIATTRIT